MTLSSQMKIMLRKRMARGEGEELLEESDGGSDEEVAGEDPPAGEGVAGQDSENMATPSTKGNGERERNDEEVDNGERVEKKGDEENDEEISVEFDSEPAVTVKHPDNMYIVQGCQECDVRGSRPYKAQPAYEVQPWGGSRIYGAGG
jgi:hypothetical protein